MKPYLVDNVDNTTIAMTTELVAFVEQYRVMWVDRFKKDPLGWHPIPENVGSDDVACFIVFSELETASGQV